MHLPNREPWKFVATARELQFFVAGAVVGAVVWAIVRALAGASTEPVFFILLVPAVLAMFCLAIVRGCL